VDQVVASAPDGPVVLADREESGADAGNHDDESDHGVDQLVPLPEGLHVAIAGHLEEGQKTPRSPHQPPVDQERLGTLYRARVAGRSDLTIRIDCDLEVVRSVGVPVVGNGDRIGRRAWRTGISTIRPAVVGFGV